MADPFRQQKAPTPAKASGRALARLTLFSGMFNVARNPEQIATAFGIDRRLRRVKTAGGSDHGRGKAQTSAPAIRRTSARVGARGSGAFSKHQDPDPNEDTMKLLSTLSTAALILSGIAAEVQAMPYLADPLAQISVDLADDGATWTEARRGRGGDDSGDDDSGRGRGRGRGGDRSSDDNGSSTGNSSGSGRSRPRIPGGSGCDDPGDLLEHPECGMLIDVDGNGIDDRLENGAGGGASPSGSGRSKPRIPGGSGCDDPEDLLEHPECSA
jgi:hypothetical protein